METRIRTTGQIAAFFLFFIIVRATAQTTSGALYSDPSQPINLRVDDLVKQMTLEEKLELIDGTQEDSAVYQGQAGYKAGYQKWSAISNAGQHG